MDADKKPSGNDDMRNVNEANGAVNTNVNSGTGRAEPAPLYSMIANQPVASNMAGRPGRIIVPGLTSSGEVVQLLLLVNANQSIAVPSTLQSAGKVAVSSGSISAAVASMSQLAIPASLGSVSATTSRMPQSNVVLSSSSGCISSPVASMLQSAMLGSVSATASSMSPSNVALASSSGCISSPVASMSQSAIPASLGSVSTAVSNGSQSAVNIAASLGSISAAVPSTSTFSSAPSTSKKRKSNSGTGSAKKKAKDAKEAPESSQAAGIVYQFKVTLKHSKPPIWRRIQLREDATFYELHTAIQNFMGWHNAHLHEFSHTRGLRIGNRLGLDPDSEDDSQSSGTGMFEGLFGGADIPGYFSKDERTLSERTETISDHFDLEINKRWSYIYDFGDDWRHDVLLEKILAANAGTSYPQCIYGRRACPPEDCGGIYGFQELLEMLEKPKEQRTRDEQEQLKHYDMSKNSYDPATYKPAGFYFTF